MSYKIQLDLSGAAFGSAFTATDVTSKAVAGLSFPATTVTWGRQDQYTAINPTSVDGSFLNTDGTFTPGNTGSAYYPRIRRNLRRRVSVTVNSTTVNLSDDYATSIEVVPASSGPATTSVAGTDILGRFGGTASTTDPNAPAIGTTLRPFLAEEMLVDSPLCLYMLQEAEGAASFGDATGTNSPAVLTNSKYGPGTVTAGETVDTGFVGGGTVVGFTGGVPQGVGSWIAAPVSGAASGFSLECWIQTPTVTPTAPFSYAAFDTGIPEARIGTDGKMYVLGATVTIATSASVCDGNIHQVVVTSDGTTVTGYFDGVSIGSGPTVNNTYTWTSIALGNTDGTPDAGDILVGGALAFFGAYSTALSAGRIAAHYQAGKTAFAGERTDQRITRLLSYRANTGSSVDTGLGLMGAQSITGRSLQDCLFEVGQLEGGVVFTDGLGRVNFRSRSRTFNPTPTLTLDMSTGGIDFGSNWREDTQGVINDATITNTTTGSDQRYFNAASITTDGEYSTTYSLPFDLDTSALNMAGWIVTNGIQQQLTATPLIIDLLHVTNAQAAAVLALKPLDCIQLTNCPTPAPAATMTFIVQGGTTSLAADAASVTLNVTPLPYPVAVWDSTNWDAATATWAF